MKKVLAILALNPEYIEFAVPQLKSLLSPLNIPFATLFSESAPLPEQAYNINHKSLQNFPYITLTVPEFENYRQYFEVACKKAVMISKFILLVSQGKNYEELYNNKDQDLLNEECRDWNKKLVCDFTTHNRFIHRDEQHKKIHNLFERMDVRGKIDIKNAKKRLQIVQKHIWYQDHHEEASDKTLERVYFGIQLSSYKIGTAKFNYKYQLSNRIYLGPTSANNDLAFLMSNQANINQTSVVFDPFVGTGGLIIPPASNGASVFGCDLDMRVLNGYSVGRINKRSQYYKPQKQLENYIPKINMNFDQYEIPYPNILRMDSTRCRFAPHTQFDAIITDPPYGLRAMSRSLKKKQNKVLQVDIKEEKSSELYQEKQIQQILQQKIEQSEEKMELATEEQIKKDQSDENDDNNQQDQKQKQIQKTSQQIKKKMKKLKKKQNKQKRKLLVSEQEKQYKKGLCEKLNRDRIDNWDKFDKAVVDTTDRQVIFQGLLNIARNHLKIGGRLVFLYPIFQEQTFEGIKNLPKHQGFSVIDMSENLLSKNNSRILVTMEKLPIQ